MRSIRNAPKRPINLSLNAKVLDMAKEMGMNISQTVDALLTEEVLKQHWARWQQDNAQAITDYNARIEREGLFSDRYRTFMRPPADRDAA
ncbi:type II toxin-antitoxin system CcdA family antitoxin [Aquabacterium humicola]|uniref:type II toxin-antitoxin system CcdA family antitoxin n=1 Tax=Aquabacterium humicola TaxID=3237377 RepID=UPI002543B2D9|nr:type II toxin-antitoxin system CcdA family antitoxin [Rubrivivax pictus]